MESNVYLLSKLPPALLGAAGGKGGGLARLVQAGYPVPAGLVILPGAFAGGTLTPAAWDEVRALLPIVRGSGLGDGALAVRSSAINEDSGLASFAGEFETVLNVRTEAELRAAIETVFQSQSAARVLAYAQAMGLGPEGGPLPPSPSPDPVAEPRAGAQQAMAVIVQRQVPAALAGVLFTADPVSGSHARMVGQFVRGLGDQLVSGEADGEPFSLARPRGKYSGPTELRPIARQLFQLARRLESELGGPQDIEWAVADGRLALLQARPITTLRAHNSATGEWNDSLAGDYLWTNTNYGEAVPDVMTPATWSLIQRFMNELLPVRLPGSHPFIGNIGGRFYLNVSFVASMFASLGFKRARIVAEAEEFYGRFPPDLEIPLIPYPLGEMLKAMLPFAVRAKRRVVQNRRALPEYLAGAPAAAAALRTQIAAAGTPRALAGLWQAEIEPAFRRAAQMMQAGTSGYENAVRPLRQALRRQVGLEDSNALLSGLNSGGTLASLGPVVGLWQVSQGQLTLAEYAEHYGHRGAHELELSWPRPAEDPAWIETLLEGQRQAPVDVPALLAQQQAQHDAAWQRYAARFPRQAPAMRRKLDAAAEAARGREASRSEMTRMFGVVRDFGLRAGALTGLGEDAFFLSLDELAAVLLGAVDGQQAIDLVPARKDTHARYSALPPYPALIRGRFDPVQWAADPRRRGDRYEANAPGTAAGDEPAGDTLTGYAGAAGVVEGLVRVLPSVEAAGALQPGEILVAATTNIGWTPVFPRAAAVVTDVGAPLSHAAIVARELGIPAVVGVGTATTRLRTGDRVRVNGGLGTVEVIG